MLQSGLHIMALSRVLILSFLMAIELSLVLYLATSVGKVTAGRKVQLVAHHIKLLTLPVAPSPLSLRNTPTLDDSTAQNICLALIFSASARSTVSF